uniref:Uncharacterized protein n=1 Tax=Siphoviridae sp. ctGFb30 TaxID=2826219 RepID=A0A8S5MFN9_9CAUD|nr:MAG TPA: hypothetical protein [Siphoviridae sp. ctGFb30]
MKDFLALQRGFPLPGINFDSPGATGKISPAERRGIFFGAPAGINFDSPERPEKISPAERRGIFFGAPAGISPIGDKLRLPGSDQKKISPPKGEEIFWCSSGDSNPNKI